MSDSEVAEPSPGSIDWLISRVQMTWDDLPKIAAELDEFDADGLLNFSVQWDTDQRFLYRLDRAMAEDDPAPEQRARYEQLQQLVERNRPYRDQIMRRRQERD